MRLRRATPYHHLKKIGPVLPIHGSERTPLPGARVVSTPDPNERINVTVIVRPRLISKELTSVKEMGILPPNKRRYLSREEFAATQRCRC